MALPMASVQQAPMGRPCRVTCTIPARWQRMSRDTHGHGVLGHSTQLDGQQPLISNNGQSWEVPMILQRYLWGEGAGLQCKVVLCLVMGQGLRRTKEIRACVVRVDCSRDQSSWENQGCRHTASYAHGSAIITCRHRVHRRSGHASDVDHRADAAALDDARRTLTSESSGMKRTHDRS